MDTHKLFEKFNSVIKLTDTKINKLKSNRRALRNKIKDYFLKKDWTKPKFYSQGSFPLKTNINPLEDNDYDLDDGAYFICPAHERKEPSTYHDRIKNAVDGHATDTKDKNTCVRVIYADDHHVDIPCYWIEHDSGIPQLAHKSKGFIESDPKAFKDWVEQKISYSSSNGQLRRIIRYLKAWKDHRESENSSLKLPSGFILTILVCQKFRKDDRHDLSFKNTIQGIKDQLDDSFTCYRPTVPRDEDLLVKYSKDTVLKEFESLLNNAQQAIASNCEKEASEYWQKVFGARFPLGQENKSKKQDNDNSFRTKIERPWLSS